MIETYKKQLEMNGIEAIEYDMEPSVEAPLLACDENGFYGKPALIKPVKGYTAVVARGWVGGKEHTVGVGFERTSKKAKCLREECYRLIVIAFGELFQGTC